MVMLYGQATSLSCRSRTATSNRHSGEMKSC